MGKKDKDEFATAMKETNFKNRLKHCQNRINNLTKIKNKIIKMMEQKGSDDKNKEDQKMEEETSTSNNNSSNEVQKSPSVSQSDSEKQIQNKSTFIEMKQSPKIEHNASEDKEKVIENNKSEDENMNIDSEEIHLDFEAKNQKLFSNSDLCNISSF
jgi:hypothetical protein